MKVLVCGTKLSDNQWKKGRCSYNMVRSELLKLNVTCLIEGCCANSADAHAETFARERNLPIQHFPANEGNYLKRNIEMVARADYVLCFWDGWSHGSSHTATHATLKGIPVKVVKI